MWWRRESHTSSLLQKTETWLTVLASRLQWGLAIKVHADDSRSSEASPTSLGLPHRAGHPTQACNPGPTGAGSIQGQVTEKLTEWALASALLQTLPDFK